MMASVCAKRKRSTSDDDEGYVQLPKKKSSRHTKQTPVKEFVEKQFHMFKTLNPLSPLTKETKERFLTEAFVLFPEVAKKKNLDVKEAHERQYPVTRKSRRKEGGCGNLLIRRGHVQAVIEALGDDAWGARAVWECLEALGIKKLTGCERTGNPWILRIYSKGSGIDKHADWAVYGWRLIGVTPFGMETSHTLHIYETKKKSKARNGADGGQLLTSFATPPGGTLFMNTIGGGARTEGKAEEGHTSIPNEDGAGNTIDTSYGSKQSVLKHEVAKVKDLELTVAVDLKSGADLEKLHTYLERKASEGDTSPLTAPEAMMRLFDRDISGVSSVLMREQGQKKSAAKAAASRANYGRWAANATTMDCTYLDGNTFGGKAGTKDPRGPKTALDWSKLGFGSRTNILQAARRCVRATNPGWAKGQHMRCRWDIATANPFMRK